MEWRTKRLATLAFGLALAAGTALAVKDDCWLTGEPAQIVGDTPDTGNGWESFPLVTVGETNADGDDVNLDRFGYRVPGILDGIGAWKRTENTVRVLVNHEFGGGSGYAYKLANGTVLTGARVSYFDIHRTTREVCAAGLAYDRVYDRAGNEVTSAAQVGGGFNRFCSSHGFDKGDRGFEDDVYFCGEEASAGQECVIDVANEDLYVVPMLGRAAFENICAVENFRSDKVAILIGDDTSNSAPLYLYVGQKDGAPASGYSPPEFLQRNGLGLGNLFVWVADAGDDNPSTFKGTGSSRTGKFKKIKHFDPAEAGNAGWDSLGFATQTKQYDMANAIDAFTFARPEDLSANPKDRTEAVFVSTGSSGFGGADKWGTVYIVDIDDSDFEEQLDKDLGDIDDIVASMKIVYDCDDAGGGQFAQPNLGLRSPDNLDWAGDGKVYIQEDRAVSAADFGSHEASAWCLDPSSAKATRILQIDRSAVPLGQTDSAPADVGNWESSGVLDVTKLFPHSYGETLLILDTQAHSISSGLVGGGSNLVEGGQLLLAAKVEKTNNGKKK